MRGMMMNPDKKAGMLMPPPGIVMIICRGRKPLFSGAVQILKMVSAFSDTIVKRLGMGRVSSDC